MYYKHFVKAILLCKKFFAHEISILITFTQYYVKINYTKLDKGVLLMDLKEFGVYLAKLRENSGYKSQRQLALSAGVAPATLSRIEAGIQEPTPQTLKKISKHLKDVEYEELMNAAGYLENTELHSPDKKTEKKPEEEFEDPELNIFFKEVKEDSPERQEQLMKIWKIIKSEEK
jgi:transcriptional regulator with XRE-family HTH domain